MFRSLATRTGRNLSWVPDWSGPKRHNSLVKRWDDYSADDETCLSLYMRRENLFIDRLLNRVTLSQLHTGHGQYTQSR